MVKSETHAHTAVKQDMWLAVQNEMADTDLCSARGLRDDIINSDQAFGTWQADIFHCRRKKYSLLS